MECKLTIFTPVYNRAHCIHRCYESMLRQENKNFIWIIIDDGSTDHLEEVVRPWLQNKQPFSIEFYRKENGGMYTAYNLALKHVTTDYWTCIDSDDWLSDNAVALIYKAIQKREANNINVCGFVGLDALADGTILGGRFKKKKKTGLMDLKIHHKHKGDMKMVYRTEMSAPFTPMPEIKGEKDFNPYYMMLQMDEIAPLMVINEVLCIVDYQPDGMSASVFKSYVNSPVSFGMLRLQYLEMKNIPLWFKYKQCIHYVSSWLLAKEQKKKLKAPVFSLGLVLAIPPGVLLYVYIKMRNNK